MEHENEESPLSSSYPMTSLKYVQNLEEIAQLLRTKVNYLKEIIELKDKELLDLRLETRWNYEMSSRVEKFYRMARTNADAAKVLRLIVTDPVGFSKGKYDKELSAPKEH